MSNDKAPTPTESLLAWIGEDEAVARAVAVKDAIDATVAKGGGIARFPSGVIDIRPRGRHYADGDPARVLAECAAKRAIVALHSPTADAEWYGDDEPPEDGLGCAMCGTRDEYAVAWPCPTLRILAAIYSWHPDYRTEWRP